MVALQHSIRRRGIVQEQNLLMLHNNDLPYNFIVNFGNWSLSYDGKSNISISCYLEYVLVSFSIEFRLGEELTVLKFYLKVLTQGRPSEIIKHVLPLYEWKGTSLRMNIRKPKVMIFRWKILEQNHHWVRTRILQLLN